MTRGTHALSFLITASLAACGGTSGDGGAEKAPDSIQTLSELFATKIGPEGMRIGVATSALDRELLLTASLINQDPVPGFSGLETRIVRFVFKDGALHLLDVTDPSVTYGPRTKLLATFSVVEETGDHVFFDFTEGTSTLFSNSDWYAPDSQGLRYNPSTDASILNVSRGYLDEVSLFEGGILYLRQISQLTVAGASVAPTVEVRYTLRPYAPDPTFKPQPAEPSMDRVGFFTANPRFRSDELLDQLYVAKFSTGAPIKFAISANTPQEYRQAVRDGILYWNIAIGRELITVEDAPEGISAPDPRYNLIQWVPYDTAGGAYADAQLDPRTGQVLHANVFLTSAFSLSGKGNARKLLGARARRVEGESGEAPLFFPASWPLSTRCRLDALEALDSGLVALLADAPTDALVERASQDYLREVVAHEVGHTLGLRHNFAGSHGQTYATRDLPDLLHAYVSGGEVPETIVGGASVMDYEPFFDAATSGSRMRRRLPANPYDVAAMRILYGDGDVDRMSLPLFCTDTHIRTYLDCQPFDVSGSPVQADIAQERSATDELAASVAETFAIYRIAFPALPLEAIPLDASALANQIYGRRRGILRMLGKDTRLLAVDRQFLRVDASTAERVKAALDAHVLADLEAGGGLAALLTPADRTIAQKLPEAFSTYVRRPEFQDGPGWNERTLHFDEATIETMERIVGQLAVDLEEALVTAEVAALADEVVFSRGPRGDVIVPVLKARMEDLLFTTDGADEVEVMAAKQSVGSNGQPGSTADAMSAPTNPTAASTPVEEDSTSSASADPAPATASASTPAAPVELETKQVVLPRFRAKVANRIMAAGLLARRRGEGPTWAMAARQALKTRLLEFYKTADGLDLLALDPERQPKPVAEWILENRSVRDSLN